MLTIDTLLSVDRIARQRMRFVSLLIEIVCLQMVFTIMNMIIHQIIFATTVL